MPILERKYDDYQRRASDIESLKQIAMGYKSIETFLVELIAIEPAEKSIDDIITLYEDEQPVILSTIHSAKGLEWDIVFIIGLADGHFPVSHNVMSEEELEEIVYAAGYSFEWRFLDQDSARLKKLKR